MKLWKIFLVTFGIMSVFHGFAGETGISLILNSGHKGTVQSLVYSEVDGYLFSAGSDGFIKIWKASSGKLVSDIHVTTLSIRSIAVNDSKSQFAVLETNGTSVFRISVWDWKRSVRLFILELDEYPLYIGFSPRGSYLMYTKTDWNSVTILDSTTGRKLPYLSQGFGIVSFMAMSDAENTVITYGTSGTISYWDLKTSKLRYQFRTLPNLSAFSVNSTKRYMAATDGTRLLFIDLTKDSKYVSVYQSGITKTEIDRKTGTIACYYGTPEASGFDISFWDFASDRLVPRETVPILRGRELTDFSMDEEYLYAAVPEGIIRRYDLNDGAVFDFPGDLLAEVYGVSAYGTSVSLDTGNAILTFESDFFSETGSGNMGAVNDLETGFFFNPLSGPVHLLPVEDEEFILWTRGDSQGAFVRFDFGLGRATGQIVRFGTALRDVSFFRDSIAALDTGGICRVYDGSDMRQVFEYSSMALRSLALVSDSELVLGQNSIGRPGFPLLHVDIATGETVPISDPALMIFRFEGDAGNGRLFSLGLERRDDAMFTVLKVHRGPSYENGLSLFSYKGEDLEAAMTYDEERKVLYTTLGADVIRAWTGANLLSFQASEHVPGELFVHGNFLFSRNRDGTVSMWQKATGKKLLDFYLLMNGSWVAIYGDNTFSASPGAESYVNAWKDFLPVPADQRRRVIDPPLNRGTDSY